MDEFFKVLLLWQLCPAADQCSEWLCESGIIWNLNKNFFINTGLN